MSDYLRGVIMVTCTPILDDIMLPAESEKLEELVEIWRKEHFPEYDIDDIRIHV